MNLVRIVFRQCRQALVSCPGTPGALGVRVAHVALRWRIVNPRVNASPALTELVLCTHLGLHIGGSVGRASSRTEENDVPLWGAILGCVRP